VNEGPGRQVRWQEPTKSGCFALLSQQQLGRVAVVDDQGGPIVFPVNFALDRHMVVFRTGEGTKLDAATRGSRAAFEVDGTNATARTGWSVASRGEAVEVTDPAESWRACASCHCVRERRAPRAATCASCPQADRPADLGAR
jgi:nitroimidazol reductase NimA-like FMN-containing flavoprotein (pyridoxamine 5'-phosphate oxidase superfamily)